MDDAPIAAVGGGGTMGAVAMRYDVHVEQAATDPIKLYIVTGDQLDALARSRRDGFSEAMWAMVGTAGGAVCPALEALYRAYIGTPPVPIGLLNLFEIALVLISAAAALTIFLISRRRSQDADVLVRKIKKTPLTTS